MALEKQQYAGYNVLARKPLIGGVPIITLLILLSLMLVTGIVGIVLMGLGKGLILPALLGFLLFLIRLKCMDDSRAMESVWWESKGALSRVLCQSSVASFTSTTDSEKKRKDSVIDWFKNHTLDG